MPECRAGNHAATGQEMGSSLSFSSVKLNDMRISGMAASIVTDRNTKKKKSLPNGRKSRSRDTRAKKEKAGGEGGRIRVGKENFVLTGERVAQWHARRKGMNDDSVIGWIFSSDHLSMPSILFFPARPCSLLSHILFSSRRMRETG